VKVSLSLYIFVIYICLENIKIHSKIVSEIDLFYIHVCFYVVFKVKVLIKGNNASF